jgi:hypothetical protein
MKKKIILIGIIAILLLIPFTGCSVVDRLNNTKYTSPDGTFSITVETLVKWKEYREVDNRIDLMEDRKDNAITIDRISKEDADYASYANIIGYAEHYLENAGVLDFIVTDGALEIANDLFIETKSYEILMHHDGVDYYGYIVYAATEEDVFVIFVSGSNENVVENYKEVANSLELN